MSKTDFLRTSGHIDWLAVTFKSGLDLYTLIPPETLDHRITLKGAGAHGYKNLYQSSAGILYMTDGSDSQGIHMVVTGVGLEEIRLAGAFDRDLIRHILGLNGRLARLDLALDLVDGKMTVVDLAHDYTDGHVKTRATSGTLVKELNGSADTLYVGSRASERFFRAYNKGAQLGVDFAWLRLELECKKVVARHIASTIANHPNERKVINTAIKKFVDFPRQMEFQRAIKGSNVPIPPIPRKDGNTLSWLLETVPPALARFEAENPDIDVETLFVKAWEQARSKINPAG